MAGSTSTSTSCGTPRSSTSRDVLAPGGWCRREAGLERVQPEDERSVVRRRLDTCERMEDLGRDEGPDEARGRAERRGRARACGPESGERVVERVVRPRPRLDAGETW